MVRESLNRSDYINAALGVVADVGVDKLSMRKVASRLDVSPMAMYKHFPGKEELLAAALDEFILRADVVPDPELHWEQWVDEVARRMYRALCKELSWVPLLGSLRLGTQAASVTYAFVQRLCSAGFSMEQSLNAYYAVIQTVIGAVCLRASLQPRTAESGEISSLTGEDLEPMDKESLRILPVLEVVSRRDQIDIGLPLLLDALRDQLQSAVNHPGP